MKVFSYLLIIFTFIGCTSSNRYTKIIIKKYQKLPEYKTISDNDHLQIDTKNLNYSVNSIVVKKQSSYFYPIILFWLWGDSTKIQIKHRSDLDRFCSHFNHYADSAKLIQQLNGAKLKISLDQIPNTFTYNYDAFYLYLLFTYVQGTEGILYPLDNSFKCSYKLTTDSNTIKSGKIEFELPFGPFQNNGSTSKRFLWYYIDEYQNYLKQLGQMAVESLVKEIN